MPTPDTFTEFVAARYPALLRTARLLVADAHAAEDLVQEALARCVPAWGRIEGDPEPYVRTVLVRQNISRWRRRRVAEVFVESLPEVATYDADAAVQDELTRALGQLAPRQRAVVVLRHVEDRPEREVAQMLGCSVGTVKSQAHAGLARLRRILAEDEGGEASSVAAASLTA
ncbi:SigE family RNA polymerase sigma factor [Nocardioides daphniae]|uniref:RNA polymerase sigma-E factor n=1 Tax=Nocardioides daphniae TaxID=402297 RepID=A0A4P7UAH5_9ACTN|nr:SigE family RNA polymerase sigma factor [Nocardioides daphniae]QCC77102.1 SigE family RNA polymerase sigma factor [Nocardioides daphniae]GGD19632.1 RNA polymerase sigma-E factor [Nocardioides daphniae]